MVDSKTATKDNVANLSSAINGHVQGVHIYLRSSDGDVKVRINYNTGLDDAEYQKRDLTLKDAADLYRKLNGFFQQLNQDGDSENLRKLIAQDGWFLYNLLIPDDDKLKIDELHSQYLAEESSLDGAATPHPYKFLIKSNGVTVPWELLYTQNPYDEESDEVYYDEKYFLGYWALIQQDPTPHSRNDPSVFPLDKHGIKIFFDHNLQIAKDVECPGIKTMFKGAGFNSHKAKKLTKDDRSDAFLIELTRKPGCIVHLACHSSQKQKGDGACDQYIRINENYILEEDEIRRSPRRVKGEPLLFLNSCEMALVQPDRYCTFLNYLFSKGFSAIIATEIEITDQAAWDFAKLVYSHFLEEEDTLFDIAIFKARRAFLDQFGSLIGFTYSYYGLGNISKAPLGE